MPSTRCEAVVLALTLIRQQDFMDASGGTLEALSTGSPATPEARLAA